MDDALRAPDCERAHLIVGIETGGTKVVCLAADVSSPSSVVAERRFPTTTPEETIAEIQQFIRGVEREDALQALGIASFGPANTDPGSDQYGWITTTPKPGWQDTDLLGCLTPAGVPSVFVSDVTGAAIGEQRHGTGHGTSSLAYATIGTGVGVGLVRAGAPVTGNAWPEFGHIPVRRHPADDYPGNCPYHADCLEGLAAGPAVLNRWGADTSSLRPHVRVSAFEVLGSYIAQLAYTVIVTTGAERVVLGGGVMQAPGLLRAVQRQILPVGGGYGPRQLTHADTAEILFAPLLQDSGANGALSLAASLLE